MKNDDRSTADSGPTEVVISKENAVFWMDGQGRWRNRHGPFANKRIIDHFNRAIGRDQEGYYVAQTRGEIHEKVYFAVEDTALFVVRIIARDPIELVLNTQETRVLDPTGLFVEADQLYMGRGDERIKFSDRALMAMLPYLDERADGMCITIGGHTWPIAEGFSAL